MFSQTGNLGDKNPEKCKENLSLYTGYLTQKMYKKAFKFWNKTIEFCPEYSSNFYDNGVYIAKKLMKEKGLSDDRKTALKDSILWMYTENIRIFGENAKINGKYGYDLVYYKNDYTKGAELMKKAIDKSGDKSSSRVISKYSYALKKLILSKKTDCDELVKEYDRLSEIIDKNKNAKGFDKAQKAIDKNLGPCLTCDKLLPRIRAKKFEKAKTDGDLRRSVLSTLKKRGCSDNDVYSALAIIEAEENPSANAFRNLGVTFYNKGSYNEAFKYFDKAVNSADNTEKEEILEDAMSYAQNAKQGSKAKSYAKQLGAINPGNTKLARFNETTILYKASKVAASGCATSAFEQKALNWAAYDIAVKVSSSAASKYKARFPTKKEIFENGLSVGGSYKTCNGISTTIRAK